MARTQQEKSKEKSKGSAAGAASRLLHEDHVRVQEMFKEYAKADASKKQELAQQICSELTVHARIEEELFYPGLREASDETDMIDEAEVEHASAKQLIEEIESMDADERLFDANITVLGQYVNHHSREEEKEMFPEAKKACIDTAEMAEQLKARNEELQRQLH